MTHRSEGREDVHFIGFILLIERIQVFRLGGGVGIEMEVEDVHILVVSRALNDGGEHAIEQDLLRIIQEGFWNGGEFPVENCVGVDGNGVDEGLMEEGIASEIEVSSEELGNGNWKETVRWWCACSGGPSSCHNQNRYGCR